MIGAVTSGTRQHTSSSSEEGDNSKQKSDVPLQVVVVELNGGKDSPDDSPLRSVYNEVAYSSPELVELGLQSIPLLGVEIFS